MHVGKDLGLYLGKNIGLAATELTCLTCPVTGSAYCNNTDTVKTILVKVTDISLIVKVTTVVIFTIITQGLHNM